MPTCRNQEDFEGSSFCFIHVPKTAGVSVTNLLDSHNKPYSLDEGLRDNII